MDFRRCYACMRELAEALGCAAPTPDARESAYQAAKALLEQGDANALTATQRTFASLGSYLDAQSLAAECDRLLQAQKPPAEKKPDGEKELPSMPPKPRRRLWIPLLAAALLAGFVLLRPTGGSHLLGLRADGTLIASGDNRNSQCSVEDWSGIVSIAAGFYGSMGIHADGTVIGVGSNQSGMLNAEDWTDIRLPAGRG